MVRPEASSVTLVKNIATEFAKHGISSERIYVRDNRREGRDHMSYYNEIDISLDTFPLTGGTTTCEATWMGVPVVTLVGDAFHQRISYSALMQCGLEELCTFTQDEFVERALRLTGEREKLAMWRTGFRQIMQTSPLCDEPRFLYQFQEMLEQVARLHGLR
jgi:predicted O-linked N-acetylglucosamine transferase (SPINDLY family)